MLLQDRPRNAHRSTHRINAHHGLHFGTSMNSRYQLPSYTVTLTHSTAPSSPTAACTCVLSYYHRSAVAHEMSVEARR